MSESENKKLSELRVVDLRAELEKRGLDRNGVKQVLLERLNKALTDEGLDPETYIFEITDKKRLSTRLSIEGAEEEKSEKTDVKSDADKDGEEIETESKPKEDNMETKNTSVSPEKQNLKEEKAANNTGEENDGHESPIRLTLEDDDETLHDVENEATAEKVTQVKEIEQKAKDKKSNSSEPTAQSESKSTEQSPEKPATSGGDSNNEEKESGDGSASGGKSDDTKLQNKVGAKSNPNVIWISNVAQNTRASELKAALSACGKVTGAKVVVNARFPGTCCFGYVTMNSIEDVENVIAKLNNTELNGQIIKIDKFDHVRAEQMKQLKAATTSNKPAQREATRESKSPDREFPKRYGLKTKDKSGTELEKKQEGDNTEKDGTKKEESKNGDSKEKAGSRHSRDRTRGNSKNGLKSGRSDDGKPKSVSGRDRRGTQSRDRDRRHGRPNSKGRNERDVLTFDKIREERERQRLREKERLLREETRRRHEEAARQREVERRQRSEAHRLEREKEKLRMEREKIERDKAELVKMERERQRLEREKLALEKMELERTLMRLGEERERRAVKRPAPYRREDGFEDRKRSAADRHFEEPPPPPRFDTAPSRPTTVPSGGSGKYEGRPYEGRDSRGESRGEPRNEPRGRELPPSRPKDSRYVERERERDRSPHFRPSVRDDRDRRPIPDNKPDMPMSSRDHRYPELNQSGPGRFDRNSSSWPNPPQKPFSSVAPSKPWVIKGPWRSETAVPDRWPMSQGGGSMRQFAGNSNSELTPVCPPPPGIKGYPDRFDYNKSLDYKKSMGGGMRKY